MPSEFSKSEFHLVLNKWICRLIYQVPKIRFFEDFFRFSSDLPGWKKSGKNDLQINVVQISAGQVGIHFIFFAFRERKFRRNCVVSTHRANWRSP